MKYCSSKRVITYIAIAALQTTTVFGEEFPPDLPSASAPSEEMLDQVAAPPSVKAQRIDAETWRCTFTFKPSGTAQTVTVAGDFNGWNPRANPMSMRGDGTYVAEVELEEGTRYYKFVVDERNWYHDPRNPDRVNDGHGGANSVLRLGAQANLSLESVALGDGAMNPAGLAHEPQAMRFRQRLGNGKWLIRYQTLRGDVQGVTAVGESIGEIPLKPAVADGIFDYWEAELPQKWTGSRYTFILSDGDLQVRDNEIYKLDPSGTSEIRTPDWAKDAIWYQIMVDRFRNGEAANDPVNAREWRSEWYSASPWEGRDGQSFYEWFVFSRLYGGDIQGLTEKLDYLKDLGVNALYLNPVFQAESCHKYNTTNYIHIDERYGQGADYADAEKSEDLLNPDTWQWTESDKIFLEFIKLAKSKGFRVIIDGVFNHVGTQHPAFRDVLTNGESSRFADWFDIRSWDPFVYEGWAGFGDLPAFKKSETGLANDEVKEHIFHVTRRWMDPDGDGDPSDGVDGWRLDVPNEIPIPFWVDWCAHVRSINPDAYITGEIWDRADEWLDGKTFDAVMNYEFSKVVFDWVGARDAKITATEADQRLAALRMAYPTEITYVLQNLVDSHDTDRAVSKIHNPDRPFDSQNREQDDPTYDGRKPPEEAYDRLKLIAFIQFTYVGAPMVYYGDEVGMWGSDDPNNRKPMIWDDLGPYENADQNQTMNELHEYYKSLTALRNEHSALRRGSIQTAYVHDDDDVWAFIREDENGEILVGLNASENEATITMPDGNWTPLFGSGSDDKSIEGLSGRIWLKAR